MAKTLGSLNVGDKLEVPVNAEYQERYGKSIVWRVAAKAHVGFNFPLAAENAVTLITDKIISMQCYDAREPANATASRKTGGNNYYHQSNIRQWLNSDKKGGEWFVAQSAADKPPTAEYVKDGLNAYNDRDGFLTLFSKEFLSQLYVSAVITNRQTVDGGGAQASDGKFFIPTAKELAMAYNIAESGNSFPLFSTNASRVAYPTPECVENSEYKYATLAPDKPWAYRARSLFATTAGSTDEDKTVNVSQAGTASAVEAFSTAFGIRPCCNLPHSFKISDNPNSQGNYTISNEHTIKVKSPIGYARVPEQTAIAKSGESIDATFHLPQAPPVVIYGIRIDKNNADPAGALTYTDDAVGMIPGSNDWFDVWPFNAIYPCIFKDGKEVYKLDKQDIRKKIDGTPSVLTGADGDAMVRLPQIWISVVDGGSFTQIKLAEKQVDETFYSLNDIRGGQHREQVYIGMFEGSFATVSGRDTLRSIANILPTASTGTNTRYRAAARASRKGYEVNTWYNHFVIQCLFLLFYKDRNSQNALGHGLVTESSLSKTGLSTAYLGANYGAPFQSHAPMKFLWLENLWGNQWEWLEGAMLFCKPTIATLGIKLDSDAFDDSLGHTAIATIPPLGGGEISSMTFTPNITTVLPPICGFVPAANTATTITHYCDAGRTTDSTFNALPMISGNRTFSTRAGVFVFDLTLPTQPLDGLIGARLCYI